MKMKTMSDSLTQVFKKAQLQLIFNHLMETLIKDLLFLSFNHQLQKANLTVKRQQKFNLVKEIFQKALIIQKYNRAIQKGAGVKENEVFIIIKMKIFKINQFFR